MTNREMAKALDPQLTHCLNRTNSILFADSFGPDELSQVRVYLGMALGMTSGFAPDRGGQFGFQWAEALATLTERDDLIPLKETIFDSAFAALNAAYNS